MSVKTKETILAVVGIAIVAMLLTFAGPFDKMFASASDKVVNVAGSSYNAVSGKIESIFNDDEVVSEDETVTPELQGVVKDAGASDVKASASEAAGTPTTDASDSEEDGQSVKSQIQKAKELGVADPLRAAPDVMARVNATITSNPTASGG